MITLERELGSEIALVKLEGTDYEILFSITPHGIRRMLKGVNTYKNHHNDGYFLDLKHVKDILPTVFATREFSLGSKRISFGGLICDNYFWVWEESKKRTCMRLVTTSLKSTPYIRDIIPDVSQYYGDKLKFVQILGGLK